MVSSGGARPPRPSLAIGTNPGRNRAHNRRVVLEAIRLHGHLGRSEIARHARLTSQAVSNIVGDLLCEGLVVELGRLRTGRGQPPLQFGLNPDGPLTAGVEIGADRIVAVLMDLSGQVRARHLVRLEGPGPGAVAAQLVTVLEALCAEAGIGVAANAGGADLRAGRPSSDVISGAGAAVCGSRAGDGGTAEPLVAEQLSGDQLAGAPLNSGLPAFAPPTSAPPASTLPGERAPAEQDAASIGGGRILGLGVVMPGPFEIDGMSSVGPGTLPGWAGIDAAALLRAAVGLPVTLGNDATAAAVGESLYGAGRRIGSFCHLYFGSGLGLGIIQDGRPLRGAFGNAGEIGHVTLAPRRAAALPQAPGPGAAPAFAVPPVTASAVTAPAKLLDAAASPPGAMAEPLPLERVASLHALRERLALAGISAPRPEDLLRLHHEDSPQLAAWITEAADYLAPTVAMLENIFDPELVIFGGDLPDAVMERLIAALDPLPVSVATRRRRSQPRVLCGQSGQMTAALGAAALPLLDTVSPHLSLAGPAA